MGNQYWSTQRPVLVHFSSTRTDDEGPSRGRALHRKEQCIIGEIKQEVSPFARPTSAQ